MSYSSEVLADSPLWYARLGETGVVNATTATASSAHAVGPASNAINGTVIGSWITNGVVAGWLRLQFASAVTLTAYQVCGPETASGVNRAPKDWTFEGSNDGTTFTTLDTRTSQTSWASNETRRYTFSNSTAYLYYRINITANNGDASFTQIAELICGNPIADSSGNARIGAFSMGGTTFGTTGLLNSDSDTAATFDGTDDRIRFVSYQSWMAPTAVTVEAVIKTSANTGNRSILDRDDQSPRAWQFRLNAGVLEFVTIGGGAGTVTASDTTNIADNVRHHVAATYDASNIKLYIDGTLVKTQAASGALSTSQAKPSVGANFSGSETGAQFFNGIIDEAAIYGTALSGARIAAHAAQVTVVTSTGTVAATAPFATAAIAGAVTIPGTVAATAPTATVAITGESAGAVGVVTATAPTATATIAGFVAPAGPVVATAPTATAAIAGTALEAITGTVGASAPTARVFITDVADGAEAYAESAGDAGDPLDVDLDTGAEAYAESAGDAGDPISFDTGTIEAYAESWATAVTIPEVTLDPATGRPQYRLKVVDMFGVEQVELPNVAIRDATRSLNGRGGLEFSLPKDDDDVDLVTQFSEVQLWRGNQIVPRWGWFVVVDPKIDEGGTEYTYQCSGLAYYLERRIIGKERPELLLNGGFEDGIIHWTPSYDAGSNAETPPHWRIVDGRYLPDFGEALTPVEGGKAIQVFAQDKVVVTEKVAETAAIFYPNRPYASEALSAGFQPGGEQIIRDLLTEINPPNGATLTVEGHTADADAGTGYALSVRRAEAAKEVILAERPDLTVNTVGKGETEPVDPRHTEAAYKKNRRVVLKGTWTEERVGHRQYIKQSFTYEVAEADREPMEIEVTAQARIDQWTGPSKDGWMLYVETRPTSTPATLLEKSTFDVDLTSPRNVWTGISAEVKVPADGDPKTVTVRLYPTAGATSFDQVSAKPNLKLNFYETDPRDIIGGLVTHAQDAAYGKSDLNLTTYGAPVGFRMTKRYPWKDRTKVSEAVDEIVRSLNGPDANIQVTGRSRWVVVAAKQGKRTGLTFAVGDRTGDAKIDAYAGGIDGDMVATTAITQSSWSGGGMEEVFATRAREDGLVLENAYQAEQDTPRSTLLEHSRTAVKYGLSDVITHVVMSPEDTTYLLEAVDIGDIVTLDVHDSRTQVLADYRIIQANLDPDTDRLSYAVAVEL